MKNSESDMSEPHYYVALVLRGSEKQYVDLLNYVREGNGARVIYQCKSLTYLRVARDDAVPLNGAESVLAVEVGGETP
jgi:hypothetical protein